MIDRDLHSKHLRIWSDWRTEGDLFESLSHVREWRALNRAALKKGNRWHEIYTSVKMSLRFAR